MSKSVTLVTVAQVREAFAEGKFTARDESLPSLIGGTYKKSTGHVPGTGVIRGRMGPTAREDYLAAFPDHQIVEVQSGAVRTVEVPMFSPKTGRPVKPLTKTVAEVRAAAGAEGRKGRLSQADLRKAAIAFGSGEPKAAKAKA